jgi:archaellum biogenesis protein FlaJ (TadC family)
MKDNVEFWASLVLAVVVAFVVAILVPGDPDKKVVWAIEYGALVITFLFGFMVLAAIASGKIDISGLLEEKGSTSGGASMSRFQLLIFTFVVAISLLLIVVSKSDFPRVVPAGILTLLGISASTYAVSKGIQSGSSDDRRDDDGDGSPPAQGGTVTHTTVVAPPEAGGVVTHTTVVGPPTNAG